MYKTDEISGKILAVPELLQRQEGYQAVTFSISKHQFTGPCLAVTFKM